MVDKVVDVKSDAQMVIIYKKSDGTIVRVSTLSPHLMGKITEHDLDKLMYGTDTKDLAMVLIKGKQYLDIERYRVEIDVNGRFLDIVEKIDVLSTFDNKGAEVTEELLNREVDIVISVLSVVDDRERLAKYKELEQLGQNRVELMNFFKQRGV